MKSIKNWTRVLSLLIFLTMLLSVIPNAIVARAEDGNDPPSVNPLIEDKTKTGSITVTKYASTPPAPTTGNATGRPGDEVDPGYTTLQGAEFVLVRVYGVDDVLEYYNGKGEKTLTLDAAKLTDISVEDNTTWSAKYDGTEIKNAEITFIYKGTTSENGTYAFKDLPIGIYVLKEINPPKQVTNGAEKIAQPAIISIPMVNAAYKNPTENGAGSDNGSDDWVYDVHVFPKNIANESEVVLTKYDSGSTIIPGVVFHLFSSDVTADKKTLTMSTPSGENGEEGAPSVVWTAVSGNYTTNSNGILEIQNLTASTYGTQYKLVEYSAPNGYIANTTPIYFYVDSNKIIHYNKTSDGEYGCTNKNPRMDEVLANHVENNTKLSLTMHNERPNFTKEVAANPSTGTKTYGAVSQYQIGEAIEFKLEVDVPEDVAEMNTFKIEDAPGVGITDTATATNVKVMVGSDPVNSELYTITPNNPARGFTITFKTNRDVNLDSIEGKKVTITYPAKLNENAEIAGEGNGNTATLTYSKTTVGEDAPDETTFRIQDEARVYTYEYEITKWLDANGDNGTKAEGVQFNLKDSNDRMLYFTKDYDEENNFIGYRISETSNDPVLETQQDGTLLIRGMENTEVYKLIETKTVAGYNLLSTPFEISLNIGQKTNWYDDGHVKTSGEGGDTTTVEDYKFNDSGKIVKAYNSTEDMVDDGRGSSDIINKKGFVLPQTGSMGYLLFCAAGLILIGGGAALIFSDRKKVIR